MNFKNLGVIYVCFVVFSMNLEAMTNSKNSTTKDFGQTSIQVYCEEYTTSHQQAEYLLKSTIQSAVDDLVEGKFSPRALLDKIKNFPSDLLPYLEEESIVLILKNIKYNVEIEKLVSPECLQDISAMLEAFAGINGESDILNVLKSALKTQSSNEPLKLKVEEVFKKVKDKVKNTTEAYGTFYNSFNDLVKSKEYFASVSELDKQTLEMIDLLQENAKPIVDLCRSNEVKFWYYKLSFNKSEQLKKLARAFILRFASEAMIESSFKHAKFNVLDFISLSSKTISCLKSA